MGESLYGHLQWFIHPFSDNSSVCPAVHAFKSPYLDCVCWMHFNYIS